MSAADVIIYTNKPSARKVSNYFFTGYRLGSFGVVTVTCNSEPLILAFGRKFAGIGRIWVCGQIGDNRPPDKSGNE